MSLHVSIQTCKDNDSVAVISIPDRATSEQHIVKVQRVTLTIPQHRPHEFIQTVVGFLALDQSFRRQKTKQEVTLDDFNTLTLFQQPCAAEKI